MQKHRYYYAYELVGKNNKKEYGIPVGNNTLPFIGYQITDSNIISISKNTNNKITDLVTGKNIESFDNNFGYIDYRRITPNQVLIYFKVLQKNKQIINSYKNKINEIENQWLNNNKLQKLNIKSKKKK